MSIFTEIRPLVPQVRAEGLEPTLLAEQGPKPCASASFATPAAKPSRYRTGRSTVTTDGICRLSARGDPVLRRVAGRQLAGLLAGQQDRVRTGRAGTGAGVAQRACLVRTVPRFQTESRRALRQGQDALQGSRCCVRRVAGWCWFLRAVLVDRDGCR